MSHGEVISREKGLRRVGGFTAALAAAGVAGTVLVACTVGTQASTDSSTSDSSTTADSSTSDSSQSGSDYSGSVSSDSGSSSSSGSDASSGGS